MTTVTKTQVIIDRSSDGAQHATHLQPRVPALG